ncbi:hypothetical protein PS664_01938 [Pseudomonas fluorescens]|nr:hypothetical protein PS664_01938 [Pseudomonas fluorescens]
MPCSRHGRLSDALKSALFNTLAAASFNLVGDYTKNILAEGSAPKVVVHAMVGGLLAEATGGDFRTGALAAAASEALVTQLDSLVKGNDNLLTMSSQIVGVLAAAAQGDTDAGALEKGSWVAKNATQYNYLAHNQLERAAEQITRCTDAPCIQETTRKFKELSLQQDIDAIMGCKADPKACAALSKEVADTMANLNAIKDIADYASPVARDAVQNLINGNYEFQEMLATATTEHSVGAMVDSIKAKWELSDSQAQDIADSLKVVLAVGLGTAAGVLAYKRAVAGAKATGDAAGKVDDLASTKVKWVDENAGMSSRARDYNDSATGARSNPATQSGQAPALERTMPDGSTRLVKFDGVDGEVLVDRKISVVTTSKSKDQALRQSDVLSQNGLTARWEVSTQAQANRAQKMFDELGIKNISVKVIREPGNQ